MKEKMKNLGSFFLRFGISGVLLFIMFKTIDFKDIWQAIKGADLNYLFAAWIMFMVTNFIILWRWRVIMKALDLKCRRFSLVRWFFYGIFWNLFLPTSVGGDVIKGVGLSKETKHKAKVFASIILDRLCGFSGIVILSCVAFWGGRKIVQNPVIVVSIAIMACVSLTIVTVLFSHRIFSWVTKVFRRWPAVRESLMKLHYDIVLMKGKQKEAAFAILLSIMSQLVLAYEFYLTALGLHQNIPLLYFIIFSPLVCVATSLPSIGGLGVREYSWVGLLATVGVSKEVAAGLGILNSGFMYAGGILMGGLVYVITLLAGRLQYYSPSPGPGSSRP